MQIGDWKMRLRTLFIVLVVLLLIVAGLLIYISPKLEGNVFYYAEGFLLLCLIFTVFFYQKVMKTLNIVVNGMELLKEQDFSSRLSLVGQYDADRIVNIFNRMMLQMRTERLRLQEQNYFLDLIIENSPMGVVILDFNGKISTLNDSAMKFLACTDVEEVKDRYLHDLQSPLAERLSQLAQGATETLRVGDAMIYRCSRLSFVDRGFYHPFILIESLTSEVMKAEKKAYEKVIRMIAHEVNNSVTGVTSSLDSLNGALSEIDGAADLQEVMRVCVERCYSMSSFITRFAEVIKIPEPVLNTEDLNTCVARCKTIMENMCASRNINITMTLYKGELLVSLDSALIEHVLVNIIKNSVESIGNGGEIEISTAKEPFPTIVIADNGKGISAKAADKLFTPFFSTKPNGQGLGLIFIREVLMKHNCQFSLRTGDDGITRFTIRF